MLLSRLEEGKNQHPAAQSITFGDLQWRKIDFMSQLHFN